MSYLEIKNLKKTFEAHGEENEVLKGIDLTANYKDKDGNWTTRETDIVTQNDYATMDSGEGDVPFFTIKKWSGNTKATTKAKVNIVPSVYSGYATKAVTGTFKIDKATLSQNITVNANDWDKKDADNNVGKYFVYISDKSDRAKNPRVVVYQALNVV